MNASDPEPRPVLVPAGNKERPAGAARKPVSKTAVERNGEAKRKKVQSPAAGSRRLSPALSAPSVVWRHELLGNSNLSLNASCSSDASTDSLCSSASTDRIGRTGLKSQGCRFIAAKQDKIVQDSELVALPELSQEKKRCAWVTSNTDMRYVTFHDEEWGVPVHDDKKLFELLVLSGALAELTWPAILSKRHTFREVFMDFDPLQVARLNKKKIVAPGSIASSLLSEPKLHAIIENARQILKIIEEFGSFHNYCWSFVNHKPMVSRFCYQRQVPVKTAKANAISKDLVRRDFLIVGPTIIYSFMQAAGMTNDHLISCFRFEACTAAAAAVTTESRDEGGALEVDAAEGIDLDLSRAVDELRIS